MIKIYTDGATSNNGHDGAFGGWAWVCAETGKYDSGFIKNATNNICELTAAIQACKYAEDNISANVSIDIYCDSAYIVNCYQCNWWKKWEINGWINSKRELVKNRELWEQLLPYFKNPRFKFLKVKGHSTDETPDAYWNNYVDKLAVKAKSLF